MRVLHLVSSPTLTGAAEPTMHLVDGLRSAGIDADLRIDGYRTGNWAEILRQRGYAAPDRWSLSTVAPPWRSLHDVVRMPDEFSRYDLVHAHLSHDHALAVLAAAAHPIKIIRTIHSTRSINRGRHRSWLLEQSDALIVSCEAHARRLRRNHPTIEPNITVMPGVIDTDRYHPDLEARTRARNALGLENSDFAIGCTARFQAGRQHPVMLDALHRALGHAPQVRLVLIGHGEMEPTIRSRIDALDIAQDVIFAGYRRHDLPEYLNALDALVWLVNGHDATARAVLQAMATGLAVIGGNEGAIAEAIATGTTGLLVPSKNPEALAQAFVTLATRPEWARTLGQRARIRMRTDYQLEARVRTLVQLYERVLSASPR